jgi:hypothetical protein
MPKEFTFKDIGDELGLPHRLVRARLKNWNRMNPDAAIEPDVRVPNPTMAFSKKLADKIKKICSGKVRAKGRPKKKKGKK